MNYIISADKLRAARALLGWSQENLAERAGLTQATVANVEIGKHQASRTSMRAMINAFESCGVEFLPDGVRILRGIKEFSGEDAFKRLLDDVYFTLHLNGGELLILGADERQNQPGITKHVRRVRQAGIKMRVIVEEGNNHLLAPLSEYRVMPHAYFVNNPVMIYGNHVGIGIKRKDGDLIQIINSAQLAEAQRRMFNFVWDQLESPSFTSVTQIYQPMEVS